MDKISKRYTVFTVMWVLAVFFHMIHRSDLVSGIFPVLTILAGCYALLNPAKEIRLVLFSLFHACVYLINAPNTGNHAFFAFYVDLTIIILFCLNFRNAYSKGTRNFDYLKPILISFTVILYFAAVFHKLNWNYLQPESCGGTMLLNLVLNYKIASPYFTMLSTDTITIFRYINIYSSLILEMLIPILLLWRRFAWIGCLLGILLHGALGFVYFWHFTPMLYALYILFLPDSFIDKIYEVYTRFGLVNRNIKGVILGLVFLIPILYVLKNFYPLIEMELGSFSRNTDRDWSLGFNIRSVIGWFPFLIYSAIFLYFVLSFPRTRVARSGTRLSGPYFIFPLILILNGFSPYLGLKTHQSFGMFSGLMTHGKSNNHLFMPNINIVKTQTDIVIPCKNYHTNFAKQLRWRKDEKLVFYELQKRVTELKQLGVGGIELCYWTNGRLIKTQNAELDSSLIIPISWVDKKFRIYREIPINENKCYY